MSTNWTSPKTNIFAAVNDLRKCLANGHNARLVRMRNEDCEYPIKLKKENQDFRNYTSHMGCGSSVNKIKADTSMTEFQKYLSLNYVSVFGSEEAMNRYYETGVIGADNLKNMGRNHMVKVDDLIKLLEDQKDYQRAELYRRQYRAPEHVNDVVHMFDFFWYKHGSPYAVKQFKHKVWVVDMLEEQTKLSASTKFMLAVSNILMFPLKFIPRKSVLRMDEYTKYEFSIGSVTNGYSVEFQIPKKFGFK